MKNFVRVIGLLGLVNSSKAKSQILIDEDDEVNKEIIRYTLNSFDKFNVTSKNIETEYGGNDLTWEDARDVLDKLCNRVVTGNTAIKMVNDLLWCVKEDQHTAFLNILDKDLKCGVGVKLVNKIYKGLIPTFDVQLCNKYDKLDILPFKNTYASRKLDGVRLLAIKIDGLFRFFSRTGKQFFTLDKLGESLDKYFKFVPDIVLDGEICIVKDDMEDFTDTISQIKKKNHTIENPMFVIFDRLTISEFNNGISDTKFEQRYKINISTKQNQYFRVLEQTKINSVEELRKFTNHCVDSGWEGSILRNGDSIYEAKRTKNMLKVKKFHDAEYRIIEVLEGKDHFSGMLGAIRVEGVHKDGSKIISKVGSGFKQVFNKNDKGEPNYNDPDKSDERYRFWKNRDSMVGKLVTVQYFEICKNQNSDDYSLRFPVFKMLHSTERMM